MNKPYIKTEVENIFRVKMYAPKGFCLPPAYHSIMKHEAFDSSKRIKMEKDLIYYIFEFIDISLDKQKSIRKFCRDSMRKDMVSIEEYQRMIRRLENYLKKKRDSYC